MRVDGAPRRFRSWIEWEEMKKPCTTIGVAATKADTADLEKFPCFRNEHTAEFCCEPFLVNEYSSQSLNMIFIDIDLMN
jgi:hypothetical protein